MPSGKDILDEIKATGDNLDIVRAKYMGELQQYTKRKTIAYYSGWLYAQGRGSFLIDDLDMNGFMVTIHNLSGEELDLILHTPGGEIGAAEAIIHYLLGKFSDIRVIVPHLAMSAGTMIACSADQILMGKHSSLGPIDPFIGGISTLGLIEEFDRAHKEMKEDPSKLLVWQPILQKYHPTYLGQCEKAIQWAKEIVGDNLQSRMFKGESEGEKKIGKIIEELGDHSENLSHERHIDLTKCKEIGLKVEELEDDQHLQDKVLSVHHCFVHTLAYTPTTKIIENHKGIKYTQSYRPL